MKNIFSYSKKVHSKQNKNIIDKNFLKAHCLYKQLKNKCYKSDNKFIARFYLWARNLKRVKVKGRTRFVKIDKAVEWTCKWIDSFPDTYDMIIGIPRSGLVMANVIALKLGKPITVPELFIKNEYWISERIKKKSEYTNILLVDDSIYQGIALRETVELLEHYRKDIKITKAILLVTEKNKHLVDMYCKIMPRPRLFEWDFIHTKKADKLVSNLEGVLSEKCLYDPNIDGEEYIKWMKNARPRIIPSFNIDIIISNRGEKYRSITEAWLNKQGISYKKLILFDCDNRKYIKNKINLFLKIKPDICWENDVSCAKKIWHKTSIPTLCIDEMRLFN